MPVRDNFLVQRHDLICVFARLDFSVEACEGSVFHLGYLKAIDIVHDSMEVELYEVFVFLFAIGLCRCVLVKAI